MQMCLSRMQELKSIARTHNTNNTAELCVVEYMGSSVAPASVYPSSDLLSLPQHIWPVPWAFDVLHRGRASVSPAKISRSVTDRLHSDAFGAGSFMRIKMFAYILPPFLLRPTAIYIIYYTSNEEKTEKLEHFDPFRRERDQRMSRTFQEMPN